MSGSREYPLSIAQVSTADVAGGAERVALDLHREYLRRGHDATLIVGRRYTTAERVVPIPHEQMRGPWTRAWNALAPRPTSPHHALPPSAVALRRACQVVGDPLRALRVWLGHDDLDFPATTGIAALAPRRPDVLHLHNLHGGYFDLRVLGELASHAPLVVTAHDLWLATGHCAQPVDCERWRRGCHDCLHLEYPPAARHDRTAQNWARKRELFERPDVRVHLVTPSGWALEQLQDSVVKPAIIDARVIPNGVDHRVFRPGNREQARSALGIAPGACVIAFTVADTRSPYKDQPTIAAALGLVAEALAGTRAPLVYLAVGVSRLATPPPAGVTVVCLPFSPDPADVARALQAADVYVHAARAETLGLGIIEAQSCGVPAVVTRTGGAPETLVDGETGFVVGQGDAAEMAHRVVEIVSDHGLHARMSRAAAAHAAARFGLERMAQEYIDLYRMAIRTRTPA